ncbi:hypothetical protein M9H77_17304 [Catharanthus roseus]|uniref:Uncharacterized protein n=1 Tax=Catharanthus roseus TaxID=4058 RepID=A0ACC0B486_CATRO|nr:hypothetical protein M9H77_17304 [Catharanthus roseus]
MDPNLWHVRMTMRVPSFYEESQMFSFTLYSMNNEDEMCHFWTIRPDISKEGFTVINGQQNVIITVTLIIVRDFSHGRKAPRNQELRLYVCEWHAAKKVAPYLSNAFVGNLEHKSFEINYSWP